MSLNTHEKNVELLAWLIDFKHRPYSRYIDIVSKDATGIGLSSLKVLKTGTIVENRFARAEQQVNHMAAQTAIHTEGRSEQINQQEEFSQTDVADHSSKKITLEYPSGVKIKIDTSDLSLIAQLVKM